MSHRNSVRESQATAASVSMLDGIHSRVDQVHVERPVVALCDRPNTSLSHTHIGRKVCRGALERFTRRAAELAQQLGGRDAERLGLEPAAEVLEVVHEPEVAHDLPGQIRLLEEVRVEIAQRAVEGDLDITSGGSSFEACAVGRLGQDPQLLTEGGSVKQALVGGASEELSLEHANATDGKAVAARIGDGPDLAQRLALLTEECLGDDGFVLLLACVDERSD